MKEMLIMTPGPTAVAENVRLARAKVTTNPDIDLEFYDFYKRTCDKLLVNAKQQWLHKYVWYVNGLAIYCRFTSIVETSIE